ncbi:MAG: 2-oxoglutarate dehydrogenase complex dihydrolipoyllysine-residue succinyltransferase [Pseudomonadaceae bacterium]|nr:2-oxoglutarate dehydrogenase complex dihydrolipoyllysine-residue succinyltransferase [Pseudomonadaceae bacterium]
MTTAIKAPTMGESIAEATVAMWHKKVGDYVRADEIIAELETDKVNLEVNAPVAGVLTAINTAQGATVKVGEVMGDIDETAAAPAEEAKPAAKEEAKPAAEPVPASSDTSAPSAVAQAASNTRTLEHSNTLASSGPAVRKLAAEMGVAPATGSGKGGRITKADLLAGPQTVAAAQPQRGEERVPMTRIRKTIATRLKQAQNTAAMLTTYNEVDLKAVMDLRKLYKDDFEKTHGIKLGFMGFFTKAVTEALKKYPALNAEINGEDILYKQHHDIGIAVSSDKGLVVPVVRDATYKSIADIEGAIADLGTRARKGGLKPDELVGATFSITNGGVFGSMMSMPILNYPQVGILGMHAIKERPVVVDGQIVIRPMMYLALTYDHRIVDGKEAVSFLVDVKNTLENPGRLLLGV